ncbi:hypothetical protein [Solirubrobacter soli]|uniref:hypothetical protein n=1 Tax=Solirubrobacter soli TaxID=363832 RepID=UPI00040CF918|nr:hypothetical protein [Solirubrobacter soli]
MEPNRFDDVDIRIVEEPSEPRKPKRVGPAVLALTAAFALTGSLAAGASALTSTAQAPTRVVQKTTHISKQGHHGLCDKDRRSSTAALSY